MGNVDGKPLTNTDPTGLDCVYLDNTGFGVDTDPDNSGNPNGGNGIDHHSSQGECNGTGGYWAPGYVASANSVHTYSNSDLIGVDSVLNGQNVSSIANCEECSTTNSDGSLMGAMTQTFGGATGLMSNPVSLSQGTFTPNNGPAHTAVAGSVALPITPGLVFDIPFAVIPFTGKICLGLGGGVGSPGVNVGAVHSSQNIENVLSGKSISIAGQAGWWGGQWMHNTSGTAVGNSMGSPGVSLTVTGSVCF